jgi:hypothetical protein
MQTKLTRNMIRLKDFDMFYFDTRSDGPVIVCLHGRWGRAETWVDFMMRYGTKYRVIAPDLAYPSPGYNAPKMSSKDRSCMILGLFASVFFSMLCNFCSTDLCMKSLTSMPRISKNRSGL